MASSSDRTKGNQAEQHTTGSYAPGLAGREHRVTGAPRTGPEIAGAQLKRKKKPSSGA